MGGGACTLALRRGDGRSTSVEGRCHSPPTGVLLARVKVQIVEDSESYLSTITGMLAVAGHLICFHPGFPFVNVFGEDGIFRYPSRHPVQTWRRRERNGSTYGEVAPIEMPFAIRPRRMAKWRTDRLGLSASMGAPAAAAAAGRGGGRAVGCAHACALARLHRFAPPPTSSHPSSAEPSGKPRSARALRMPTQRPPPPHILGRPAG